MLLEHSTLAPVAALLAEELERRGGRRRGSSGEEGTMVQKEVAMVSARGIRGRGRGCSARCRKPPTSAYQV
jgi:hypothetical protein